MKTNAMARGAAALLTMMMLAACGEGTTETGGRPTPEPVASVAVNPGALTVEVGAEMEIAAEPLSAAGRVLAGRAVSWSSSDEAVASVSAAGRVTARNAGVAFIRATVEGKTGEARLQVNAPAPRVDRVVVMPGDLALFAGEAQTVVAIAYTAESAPVGGLPVAWSSSNEQVATVAADGRVTAVAPGDAVIRATVAGKVGEARVRVMQPLPVVARVEVTPTMVQLKPAETWNFTAQALSAAGQSMPGLPVQWSSSNPAVATVDAAGKVTARAVGEALIRATAMGVTGEGRVVVPAPPEPDPEPVVFDLLRVEGQALPGPVFERTRADGKVNVQVLGGYLKADPFGQGNTTHYEIAIFLTIVRDGVWIDSETYFDEGTVERTEDGFIFRSSVTDDFTYQGRRGPDNTIVVTTTVGPTSPLREYTFKRP
ncbi:Ig-like domain-containing protein [Longimicrobium sp.]|jgi:uncharacterized protein YjdB|uniref:Ig-like domain-containing protein n=1 Tax=Longimicrobium sp. TaxID=2029185 RepID=UPI002ED8A27D